MEASEWSVENIRTFKNNENIYYYENENSIVIAQMYDYPFYSIEINEKTIDEFSKIK